MVVAHSPRYWTRREYDGMVEAGVLGPEDRVELIEGEILNMSPQNSPHATGILLVLSSLNAAFPSGACIRCQLPLAILDDSEPEPDVAVVAGTIRDYRDHHPTTALLVVEVPDTSLDFDRETKGRLYARAGVPEYWLLNLNDAVLEVYRQPRDQHYAERIVLDRQAAISPLSRSDAKISVADLLP